VTAVVLCASFPERGPRGAAAKLPYHPVDIALAAAAVAEAVLRNGADLVFGAHPTISPIVLQTASLLDAGPHVQIFQSQFFDDQTTDEVRRLVSKLGAGFHPVAADLDRARSLTAMRQAMFAVRPHAAFFCGGMDGLVEEFGISAEARVPRFLITAPGGMAARLAAEHRAAGGDRQRQEPSTAVLPGRAYGSLVLEALETAGIREPEATGPFEEEMYRPLDGE
jgi:SLOG cluster3 family